MANQPTVRQSIEAGFAAHKAGDIPGARAHYEAALKVQPDNAQAIHLLGLVFKQEGDGETALKMIKRAVSLVPGEPSFLLSLSGMFQEQGKLAPALKYLREAVKHSPKAPMLWNRLAALELDSGDPEAAQTSYLKTYELDPTNYNALAGYGAALINQGKVGEAYQIAWKIINKAPENLPAYKLGAAAARSVRDWDKLAQVAERWHEVFPDNVEAIQALASAYFEAGNTKKAHEIFSKVVTLFPDNPKILTTFAGSCLSLFDYEGAEQALMKAQAIAPLTADGLYTFSKIKFNKGDLAEAEELCLKAIEVDPNFPLSYSHLATLTGGDVADEIVDQARQLTAVDGISVEYRASIFYALGDIAHFRKDHVDAMARYDQANALSETSLQAEGGAYIAEKSERRCKREREFFERSPAVEFEPAPATPIFVLGMPRSGTTLFESILAAHPDVFGAGELAMLPTAHREIMQWADDEGVSSFADAPPDKIRYWREQYFAHYPDFGAARFVVDKQPLNVQSTPYIRALFPEAVLIHTRRNPVDTGMSIYRNDFGKTWSYTTRLAAIAHFYGEYARTMEQCARKLGDQLPVFQYEALIADFESQARRLIAHCGLDWRDECLEFHRSNRPVTTFSAAQVRKPLQTSVASASDAYGAALDPLTEGLKKAGVHLETGAFEALR